MPFLRYFTAFYGITCVYLNRVCSITFFGFYGIVTKGSWQKIGSLVTFGISLRVYLHMTQCFGVVCHFETVTVAQRLVILCGGLWSRSPLWDTATNCVSCVSWGCICDFIVQIRRHIHEWRNRLLLVTLLDLLDWSNSLIDLDSRALVVRV